jgi:hypothetical protein
MHSAFPPVGRVAEAASFRVSLFQVSRQAGFRVAEAASFRVSLFRFLSGLVFDSETGSFRVSLFQVSQQAGFRTGSWQLSLLLAL